MSNECEDLHRDASRDGDNYYQAVTSWLSTRGRSEALRNRAVRLGQSYRSGLHFLRRCYERMRRSPRDEQRLEDTVHLQSRLDKELEFLGASTGSLRSATTDEA